MLTGPSAVQAVPFEMAAVYNSDAAVEAAAATLPGCLEKVVVVSMLSFTEGTLRTAWRVRCPILALPAWARLGTPTGVELW
jgi:hypothetical protein